MNGEGQFYDRNFTDDPLGGVSTPGYSLLSGIRTDITSWAELAAVLTVGAPLPVILEWNDSSVNLMRSTIAQLGSDATDTANGIQRADDWATSGVVWYQLGNAG